MTKTKPAPQVPAPQVPAPQNEQEQLAADLKARIGALVDAVVHQEEVHAREEFEHFLLELRRGCRDMRMDHILLRTDAPLDLALSSFLASRSSRTRN